MKCLSLLFICFTVTFRLPAQDPGTYKIFTAKGKKTTFRKLVKDINKSDVVFFGELHNNPVAHWLTIELLKSLSDNKLQFGAEMFEQKNRALIAAYMKGTVSLDSLNKSEALWPNFKTDYGPILKWVKTHNIDVYCTNVNRPLANSVYKKGMGVLNELDDSIKNTIAPLPIEIDTSLQTYEAMKKMLEGHDATNLIAAQALKDATMAKHIADVLKNDHLFFHLNGTYHNKYNEGIIWHLNRYKPGIKTISIYSSEEKEHEKFNTANKMNSDYIIQINEDVTKSY